MVECDGGGGEIRAKARIALGYACYAYHRHLLLSSASFPILPSPNPRSLSPHQFAATSRAPGRSYPQFSPPCFFLLVAGFGRDAGWEGGSGCPAAWPAASAVSLLVEQAPMAHDGLHTWGPHCHSLELSTPTDLDDGRACDDGVDVEVGLRLENDGHFERRLLGWTEADARC